MAPLTWPGPGGLWAEDVNVEGLTGRVAEASPSTETPLYTQRSLG